MTERLEGKVALVTGAASGIGRAAAVAFARAGARLVLADVSAADGERLARDVDGEFVRTDVARPEEVRALVARAVDRFGRIDCAFNNAGIEGALAPLADYPVETFEKVIAVNLLGVFHCMRFEIPVMKSQGGGAIVNTASVAGLVGAGGFSAYVASKHGVVGLTKAAAVDYAKAGIRVNAVCPGVVRTPMLDRLQAERPGLAEALLAMKPIGRLGEPPEIAAAVVWLCSDAASFVTGHALAVDGGYVAQ